MTAQQDKKTKEHKVHIVYKEGENGKKDRLDVRNYPPAHLAENHTIAFIPEPPGELKLTFKNGSNFSDDERYEINNSEPQKVVRLMTPTELTELRGKRKLYSNLTENAFPFMCELTVRRFSLPNEPPFEETYKDGFPSDPDHG